MKGYLGRVCGAGLTDDGKAALVYAISGRSTGSKSRLATVSEEGIVKKVHIGPLEEINDEQKPKQHIFFYDAIIVTPDMENRFPYGAVSNGVHTDPMFRRTLTWPARTDALEGVLKYFDYEPDSPNFTPRIAGELSFNRGVAKYMLGIATQNHGDVLQSVLYSSLSDGEYKMVATYTGENGEELLIPSFDNIEEIVLTENLEGASAKQVAESFYKKMDSDFVVATAAAVLDSNTKGWDVGVMNLHKAPEGSDHKLHATGFHERDD